MFYGALLWQVVLLILLVETSVDADKDFSFASYYNDHMVLQRAPMKATLWGYLCNDAVTNKVTVNFNNKKYNAVYIKDTPTKYRWMVTMDPTQEGGPHVITATAGDLTLTLNDVLFGDVWMCSGQSNMQFTVPSVFNASAEIAASSNYTEIRVFTASKKQSVKPEIDLLGIDEKWSVPAAGSGSIGDGNWTYFSATCWFFGRNLYDSLNYPIGLVAASWEGTFIEVWSSPDSLKKCETDENLFPEFVIPIAPSSLWNSMIHPFLKMTIYGVVWYQGESNAIKPDTYDCTFPAMIDDWRAKWYEGSHGNTNQMFPFGFVQISTVGSSNDSTNGFPDIRWHQTANFGYVPNARMKEVFMAVAMDLGDPNSPFGSVHPRYKQDVGYRLALAGRAIAYKEKSLYYTGPIASSAYINTPQSIIVHYTHVVDNKLEIRSYSGFEVYCIKDGKPTWIESAVIKGVTNFVIIDNSCDAGNRPTHVRYSWRDYPCVLKGCAVYSGKLPSPPFILPVRH
ncbi:sialate O-acetylesterase-like isoform X1 [Dysidea avara]|uniref:sialate O-acetylesterase-like isoform X1 n=2 Tax=Dysidea avara TaxID=196820 RepID=UPI0033206BF0